MIEFWVLFISICVFFILCFITFVVGYMLGETIKKENETTKKIEIIENYIKKDNKDEN